MSRSKWKGPYVGLTNFKTKELKKQSNFELPRNMEITPKLIGLTFKVHNGKEHKEITITDEMVGYKLGEFVFTRAKFVFIKKKKEKKKIVILF